MNMKLNLNKKKVYCLIVVLLFAVILTVSLNYKEIRGYLYFKLTCSSWISEDGRKSICQRVVKDETALEYFIRDLSFNHGKENGRSFEVVYTALYKDLPSIRERLDHYLVTGTNEQRCAIMYLYYHENCDIEYGIRAFHLFKDAYHYRCMLEKNPRQVMKERGYITRFLGQNSTVLVRMFLLDYWDAIEMNTEELISYYQSNLPEIIDDNNYWKAYYISRVYDTDDNEVSALPDDGCPDSQQY